MIRHTILADSINSRHVRLTTWLLTYPRFIHAEFMTHRVFSRNASSSRAIPLKKTIESIRANPALPEWWGKHKGGMQAGDQLVEPQLLVVQDDSLRAMNNCITRAEYADAQGLHKSITNRWLEPWSHITVIATATHMGNFFGLRAHPAAEPTFQVLAYGMLGDYLTSDPFLVKDGDWHIPFTTKETANLDLNTRLKIATARACWVSCNAPDKEFGTTEELIDAATVRHDASEKAGHWSPFEHCARAIPVGEHYPRSNFDQSDRESGWFQYRQGFGDENKITADLQDIWDKRPDWIRNRK